MNRFQPPIALAYALLFGPLFATGCSSAPNDGSTATATTEAPLAATAWSFDPACTLAEGIQTTCAVVYSPGSKYPAGKIHLETGDVLTVSVVGNASGEAVRAWIVGPSAATRVQKTFPASSDGSAGGEMTTTAAESGDHAIVVKSMFDDGPSAIRLTVSIVHPGTGPFDPSACPGDALSYADLFRRMPGGATYMQLPDMSVLGRMRSCNNATGCTDWRDAPAMSYTLASTLKVANTTSGSARPAVDMTVTPGLCGAPHCFADSAKGPSNLRCYGFDPMAFWEENHCATYDIPQTSMTFKASCFYFHSALSDSTSSSSHDEYEFAGVASMPAAVR